MFSMFVSSFCWLIKVIYAYVWSPVQTHMSDFGYLCLLVVTCAYLRLLVITCEYLWSLLVTCDYWSFLVVTFGYLRFLVLT